MFQKTWIDQETRPFWMVKFGEMLLSTDRGGVTETILAEFAHSFPDSRGCVSVEQFPNSFVFKVVLA